MSSALAVARPGPAPASTPRPSAPGDADEAKVAVHAPFVGVHDRPQELEGPPLGLLSSLLMTRLGHVHDGLMVSMRIDCAKLEKRAARIVATAAGSTIESATEALATASNRLKPAILIARGANVAQAGALLARAGGNLRVALGLLDSAD